jgi:predicted PhzF superfamily epimerase YddE/YHI9
MLRFSQVDVFTDEFMVGNPVAVVHDADEVSADEMAAFARWTNLSESTFLLSPTVPDADYRLRIFTPQRELPFAGHPTLGSATAWLAAGVPAGSQVVQQSAVATCGFDGLANGWRSQHRRWSAVGRSTRRTSISSLARCTSPRTSSWPRSGPTTDPAGSSSC